MTRLELAASTTPKWKNPVIFAVIVDYFNYEDEYEYEESKNGMPWWGWLLIALGICALIGIPVVIIIVVIIIIVVVKKKKKKKAAAAQNTANPQ